MGFWNRSKQKKRDSNPKRQPSLETQISNAIQAEAAQQSLETQQLISYLAQTLSDPKLELQRFQLFELILPRIDQHRSPHLWAMLHYDFGTTFLNAQTGDAAENLETAIAIFQTVLNVFTNNKTTLWGMVQNNLGESLRRRVRGVRADNLELAIDAFQTSLKVFTRNEYPAKWALLQNNLGASYAGRIYGDPAENLEKAILACRSALEIRTRDDFPIDWAQTQAVMGHAYFRRIRGDRIQNLDQAILAYTAALKIFSRPGFEVQRADIQKALDQAVSEREGGRPPENEFEAEFQQASPEIQKLIGQLGQGAKESSLVNLTWHINVLEQTLMLVDRSRLPNLWAALQYDLGMSLQSPLLSNRAEKLEQAIAVLTELELRTRDGLPVEWAKAKASLGDAFANRIRGVRAENLEQAIAAMTDALRVCNPEQFPEEWAISISTLAV